MENKFQRQTAYKVQISDVLKGKINFEADRLNSVEINGKPMLRVNVIANIVEKYSNPEKQFASLTIDDGSGQIRMKGFSDSFDILNVPMIGDTAYMIGTLKFYNDELYLLPEILNTVETKWLLLRRLELGITGTPEVFEAPKLSEQASGNKEFEEQVVTEQKIDMSPIKMEISPNNTPEPISSPKLKVLNQIRKDVELDLEQLIVPLNIPLADLNVIVKELIQEGEIYESRPGRLCAMI